MFKNFGNQLRLLLEAALAGLDTGKFDNESPLIAQASAADLTALRDNIVAALGSGLGHRGFHMYMDCSTAYVEQEDINLLNDPELFSRIAISVAPFEYGVFVTVPPIDLDTTEHTYQQLRDVGMSEMFIGLLKHAGQQGCYVVQLDSDGFDGHDLPTRED